MGFLLDLTLTSFHVTSIKNCTTYFVISSYHSSALLSDMIEQREWPFEQHKSCLFGRRRLLLVTD